MEKGINNEFVHVIVSNHGRKYLIVFFLEELRKKLSHSPMDISFSIDEFLKLAFTAVIGSYSSSLVVLRHVSRFFVLGASLVKKTNSFSVFRLWYQLHKRFKLESGVN